MGVVVVCSVLVALGVVAGVRWGGLDFQPPPPSPMDDGPPPPREVARRYLWYVAVATWAGIGSGLLMSGPGGRLAMRLLAATAGDAAQGRITEAEEIVGRVTVGGTIELVLFIGLASGLASAVLYMLIRRWLPAGRLGGVVYGALLLVIFAPLIDPLRKGNEDFDIVGPGWLSVATFVVLGLAHGMVVAALAARVSRSLPLLSADRRVVLRYSILILLLPLVTPAIMVAFVGVIVVALSKAVDLGERLRSREVMLAGRVVLVLGALAALPAFVGAVVDIAGRGP